MPTGLMLIEPLKPLLPKVIEWVTAALGQQSTDVRTARAAVLSALQDTQNYIGRIKRNEPEDYAVREQLASKWTSAAAALDTAGAKNFAHMCYQNGDYWSGAGTWTAEELDHSDISLKSVINQIQDLESISK